MELRRERLLKGTAGGALLASLALARVFASANTAAVYVAGGELPVLCVSRLLLGVTCPGCGMTRSVLMTLGGDLRGALAANAGGPLLVLAAALFGAQLLASALRGRGAVPGKGTPRRRRPLVRWASAYAAVVGAVMIAQWVSGLVRA